MFCKQGANKKARGSRVSTFSIAKMVKKHWGQILTLIAENHFVSFWPESLKAESSTNEN